MMQERTRQPQLLTVEQVSAEYGFPVATLYGWRHRGAGPASARLGARLRYRRGDIESWITGRIEAEAARRATAA
jgi:predicted DNA-binding transcriptional regulator AlpA